MLKQIIRFVTILTLCPSFLSAFSDINMEDRWHIRDFYNTVFPFGSTASMSWTGNYDPGDSGTVSAEWQEATRVRINFYRAMAGIPAEVTFDPVLNAKAQDSALMMSGNNTLNHFPPTNWTYYTADGADAAEHGNLALGSAGAAAIEGYMMDFGSPDFPESNYQVGHRRWLLYPQTSVMGSGDVPGSDNAPGIKAANTVYVITDEFFEPRPVTRDEFVAWPPAGYVPSDLVYARWSFALEDADFTNASVDMEHNGQEINVELEPLANFIGEPTLVWIADNMDTTGRATWPAPANDEAVTVTVSNVMVGGNPNSYTYTVTIFDASKAGPDEHPSEPIPLGPAIIGHPAYFQTTARPWSEGIDVREFTGNTLTGTFGGEDEEIPFIVNISNGYDLLQSGRKNSGSSAFRLAHPVGREAQTLEWENELFIKGPDPKLTFHSSLSFATEFQYCAVDISLGSGDNWKQVALIQQGPADSNPHFEATSVDLHDWIGYTLRIRFRYDFVNASHISWNPGVRDIDGWAIDDMTFEGVEEVIYMEEVESFVGSRGFPYVATNSNALYLQTRDLAFDGFTLDWGPAQSISPLPASAMLSAGVTWAVDPVFGYHREVASGWKFVRNMGWALPDHFPWIHTGSGWMYYVTGSMADGLWLYNPDEGFVFTRTDFDGRYLKAPFGSGDWDDFHP